MTTDPAQRLREAAAIVRAASAALDGQRWEADHHPEGTVVRPADSAHSLFQLHADGLRAAGTPCVSPAVGKWIALVGPVVGEALAAVLDQAADKIAAHRKAAAHIWDAADDEHQADAEEFIAQRIKSLAPALALADAVLGTTPG